MCDKQEIKYIEKLLVAFFEGTTTATEEKELYRFFKNEDIPESLKQYKPIFEYFETGIRKECNTLSEDDFRIKQPQKKRWMVWAGMAATLILAIFIGIQPGNSQKQFDPYEGSYIVRNGIRIDDPDEIRPEVEIVIERVRNKQREVELLIKKTSGAEDRRKEILNALEAQRKAILDKIGNENARREVEEIMKITPIN